MIILGIDPGTAKVGYGILEIEKGKPPHLIVAKSLVTTPKLSMPDRLRYIYTSLTSIVNTRTPDIMVIEKLFFNTNVKTAMSVGQARGIAMLVAANANLMLYEYTALAAKKILTEYGRASKQQMQEAVKDTLKLDKLIKDDDANDGVAMALCFIKKDLDNLW